MRKQKTAIQKEYDKQRRRIQQFIKRAEKRGYQFQEGVLPSIPKKKTKSSVNRLKKLTPEKLYSKAVYRGEATYGEIVSGKQGRKAERQASAQKAKKTRQMRTQEQPLSWGSTSRVVVDNVKNELRRLPIQLAGKILGLINTLINEQGVESVAKSLMDMPYNFYEYLAQHGYDSQAAIDGFSSDLVNYLPEASDAYKRDVFDLYENEELGYYIED